MLVINIESNHSATITATASAVAAVAAATTFQGLINLNGRTSTGSINIIPKILCFFPSFFLLFFFLFVFVLLIRIEKNGSVF